MSTTDLITTTAAEIVTPLSTEERSELQKHLEAIQRNAVRAAEEIGRHLKAIKDKGLYRDVGSWPAFIDKTFNGGD